MADDAGDALGSRSAAGRAAVTVLASDDDSLANRTARPPATVLDGGLATTLEARGHDLRTLLWSARLLVDDPAAVRDVHHAFFDAGADLGTSASYQASHGGFRSLGLDAAQTDALLRRSVELVREAAHAASPGDATASATGTSTPTPPRTRLVAASLGPFGACLADGSEFTGSYAAWPRPPPGLPSDLLQAALDATPHDADPADVEDPAAWLAAFHRPRLRALLAAHPDLCVFETIPCLAEAVAAARLLHDFPAARIWISFSLRDGSHLASGEPLADAVLAAEHAADHSPRLLAFGVNCCQPAFVEEALRTLLAAGRARSADAPDPHDDPSRPIPDRPTLHGDSEDGPRPPASTEDPRGRAAPAAIPHALERALQNAAAASDGGAPGFYERRALAYPNAGELWDPVTRAWIPRAGAHDHGDDSVAGHDPAADARRWVRAGAVAVGGCCRTDPDRIRLVARALRDEEAATFAPPPALDARAATSREPASAREPAHGASPGRPDAE